jgi:hypothetical protein
MVSRWPLGLAERGGPKVRARASAGFGTKLIARHQPRPRWQDQDRFRSGRRALDDCVSGGPFRQGRGGVRRRGYLAGFCEDLLANAPQLSFLKRFGDARHPSRECWPWQTAILWLSCGQNSARLICRAFLLLQIPITTCETPAHHAFFRAAAFIACLTSTQVPIGAQQFLHV